MPDPSILTATGADCASCLGALFLALLIAHAVADYPLQGTFLAIAKNRHNDASPLFPGEAPPQWLWIQALSAHSLIHAGAVWLVTGSVVLGIAEFILHWLIDYAKCERWTGFHTDQALHVACKAGYVLVIAIGWVS